MNRDYVLSVTIFTIGIVVVGGGFYLGQTFAQEDQEALENAEIIEGEAIDIALNQGLLGLQSNRYEVRFQEDISIESRKVKGNNIVIDEEISQPIVRYKKYNNAGGEEVLEVSEVVLPSDYEYRLAF